MNTSTDDRRVRKTKRALREGLAELMLEKDLRKITVRELSDKVDIHRATFYAHYTDIYGLYEELENTLIDEIGVIFADNTSDTYGNIFRPVIDYVYDNAKTCRMFFSQNGNRSFYNRISAFVEKAYYEIWVNETGQKTMTEEWWILVRYHIQGCLAIISRWVENDLSYPKDEIADLLIKVDINFEKIMPE